MRGIVLGAAVALLAVVPAMADCRIFGDTKVELGVKFASQTDPAFVEGGGEVRVTFDVTAEGAENLRFSRRSPDELRDVAARIANTLARLGSPDGTTNCRLTVTSSPFVLQDSQSGLTPAVDQDRPACAARERWRAWYRESENLKGEADVHLRMNADGEVMDAVISEARGERLAATLYYSSNRPSLNQYDIANSAANRAIAMSAMVQSLGGGFAPDPASDPAHECSMVMPVHPADLDMEIDKGVRPLPPVDAYREEGAYCDSLPDIMEQRETEGPRGAVINNVSGWAVARYDIEVDGQVTNVAIVDNEPNNQLNRTVRNTLEGRRYGPLLDGQRRTGCLYVYTLY